MGLALSDFLFAPECHRWLEGQSGVTTVEQRELAVKQGSIVQRTTHRWVVDDESSVSCSKGVWN